MVYFVFYNIYMSPIEKTFVIRSLLKQKMNNGLLAVQGGAFDIEPIKAGIQTRYGVIFFH